MDLATARRDLATAIGAETDPALLRLPGVFVGPPSLISRDALPPGCTYRLDLPVWVVAPAPANDRAVSLLLHLIERTWPTLSDLGETADAWQPDTYEHGTGLMPAYTLTVTLYPKEP